MPACGWTIEDCGGDGCWNDLHPSSKEVAAALATNLMWAGTGRRYGLCEITILPCNPRQVDPLYQTFPVGYDTWGDGAAMMPFVDNGQWRNSCGGGCTCRARCEIDLAEVAPIDDVTEVTVAGDVVDPSAYEVHDRYLLVRKDGDCWPTCQVYGQEIPGFTVTMLRGDPIPPAVQKAVERLTCEFAKTLTGKDCALPARIRDLTRQGVTVAVQEIETFDDMILTNIPTVDSVIAAENPFRRKERPRVYSPDLPIPRMITSTGGS